MSTMKSYILQVWQDENGFWAVVKHGEKLHQFETLESLSAFLAETPSKNSVVFRNPQDVVFLAQQPLPA